MVDRDFLDRELSACEREISALQERRAMAKVILASQDFTTEERVRAQSMRARENPAQEERRRTWREIIRNLLTAALGKISKDDPKELGLTCVQEGVQGMG